MTSFYAEHDLLQLGFKSIGQNVLISKKASFYDTNKISIGNNVRIDDFCILSGNIKLGSNIHISAFSAMYGQTEIEMEDYSGLSPRCTIFSAMDDFSGNYLIGPMNDRVFTNVTGGKVLIKKFSQIGAGCVIFPNIIIETGCIVGSMSLVNKGLLEWSIYAGIPAKKIRDRKQELLKLIDNNDRGFK